jgi:TPR repeat protein
MFVIFQKYAEKDFYLALDMLAAKYYQMQMIDKSMKLWKKAADQGCRISQYNLGLLLLNQNKNKKMILSETLKLWEASAAQGYLPALKDIGLMYLKGDFNGKPDYAKGIPYLEKAANLGHIQAMYVLGDIYEKGLNGKVDKDLAIKYYKDIALRHPFWQEQAKQNNAAAK